MAKQENLFERQIRELKHAEEFIQKNEFVDSHTYKKEYEKLTAQFKESLDDLKLITKVSDKLQNKVNKSNEALDKKNKELQDTLDALTKANVGRKATTIAFFIGIGLFILEELFLENIVEHHFGDDKLIGIGAKFLIAAILKPIEIYIEHRMMENEFKKQKEKDEAPFRSVFDDL
jgi:flagellar hook-basal body complex protein FliE